MKKYTDITLAVLALFLGFLSLAVQCATLMLIAVICVLIGATRAFYLDVIHQNTNRSKK